MRASHLTLASLIALSCHSAPQVSVDRVYVSDGHTQEEVTAQHRLRLERALRDLLSSCSVNSSAQAGTLDNWRTSEIAPAIVATYANPVRVRTLHKEIEVDAILFRLSSRDYILARRGDLVYAFAKWSPELEARLVCAPNLDLKRNNGVREFCDAMGAS